MNATSFTKKRTSRINQLSWVQNNEQVRFRLNASFIPMNRDVNQHLVDEMKETRSYGRLNQDRLRSLIGGPALKSNLDANNSVRETEQSTSFGQRRDMKGFTIETERDAKSRDDESYDKRQSKRERDESRERQETQDRHLSHLPVLIGDMYEPVQMLGEGSFGRVFLVKDVKTR